MPNDPKADWEKEARKLAVEWSYGKGNATAALLEAADPGEVEFFVRVIRSAHASGAREAEEKLGRAMALVEAALGRKRCPFCPYGRLPIHPQAGEDTHRPDCPLVEQGFISRDASRVGGKETK